MENGDINHILKVLAARRLLRRALGWWVPVPGGSAPCNACPGGTPTPTVPDGGWDHPAARPPLAGML